MVKPKPIKREKLKERINRELGRGWHLPKEKRRLQMRGEIVSHVVDGMNLSPMEKMALKKMEKHTGALESSFARFPQGTPAEECRKLLETALEEARTLYQEKGEETMEKAIDTIAPFLENVKKIKKGKIILSEGWWELLWGIHRISMTRLLGERRTNTFWKAVHNALQIAVSREKKMTGLN